MNSMNQARSWPPDQRQKGITMLGALLLLIVLGFLLLVAIRIVPIYIDYFTVRSTLQGMAKETGADRMSIVELRTLISKRFDIGYVSVVDPKDVQLRQQGRERVLELSYEDRRPVLGNLEAVASFEIVVPLTAGAAE